MEGMKVTLFILTTFGYCICAPGYVRIADDADASSLNNNDEGTLSVKGRIVSESAVDLATGEAVNIADTSELDQGFTVGELFRNRIGGQTSHHADSELNVDDEPQLISVPHRKQADTVCTGQCKKLLDAVIRGIMSRVLQAEITNVRVEPMNRRKE